MNVIVLSFGCLCLSFLFAKKGKEQWKHVHIVRVSTLASSSYTVLHNIAAESKDTRYQTVRISFHFLLFICVYRMRLRCYTADAIDAYRRLYVCKSLSDSSSAAGYTTIPLSRHRNWFLDFSSLSDDGRYSSIGWTEIIKSISRLRPTITTSAADILVYFLCMPFSQKRHGCTLLS